ncbi:MAG TPA: class I SAM-dependent methyltransferase [Thermoleophilaceae bacterium]
MEASVEQFKERARNTWAAGDFDEISKLILDVGKNVVAHADIQPGLTVLDIACGTGNATIPAALEGGRCTGLDLTPELFDAARRNAAEAGVEIDWVQGDAEDLPFGDGSFERVLSTFGIMFAPRHEVAAAELARVIAPGGTAVLACWGPYGLNGEMFPMIGKRMPPPPSYAQPPSRWGDEDHVRGLLEPRGLEVSTERQSVDFRSDSVESIVARMEAYFGPWKMAQAALGDDWADLRAELVDLYERYATHEDGQVAASAEYLLTIAKKPD